MQIFGPLRHLAFRIRRIERSTSDQFLVRLTTYRDGHIGSEEMTQKYEDLTDDRLESYELLLGAEESDASLDLFPFIVIKSDRLHYYNRTRPSGYEYLSVFGATPQLWPTRRKFSSIALRSTSTSDRQGLFWTQVTPSISDTGVKANIPAQEPIVGRKQQIEDVMTDIIQIPNQNGIIYGPGGVGKTALLIELSRQLSEAPPETHFRNIIWVSAKSDSHDPMLGVTEQHPPQFQSLDNILDAILDFHGFEDATSYQRDDKKWLVTECLP